MYGERAHNWDIFTIFRPGLQYCRGGGLVKGDAGRVEGVGLPEERTNAISRHQDVVHAAAQQDQQKRRIVKKKMEYTQSENKLKIILIRLGDVHRIITITCSGFRADMHRKGSHGLGFRA